MGHRVGVVRLFVMATSTAVPGDGGDRRRSAQDPRHRSGPANVHRRTRHVHHVALLGESVFRLSPRDFGG